MKCNKCNGEWTPPPGKSVTACPFCSEPIQTPSTETPTGNVIKALVQEFGENILLDSRLSSLVADKLANKEPQLLKRIRLAINESIPRKLCELKTANEQDRLMRMGVLATALTDDYGMETETAYEIVNYFADSLGYKPVTATKSAPQPQPQPQPIKTSIPNSGIKITPKISSIIPFGPYEWRVLDVQDGKALIITENVIEERKYNEESKDVTWETCTLRKYLNGGFLRKLTGEQQRRIAETRVINENNPQYGTKGGNDTSDRIFLLSLEEVGR